MRMAMVMAPLLLTACATGPDMPPDLTEKQAATLEKALAGKTAGEKVSCISQLGRTDMRAISDAVLLYRVSSRLVYKNEVIGRCTGLARGNTLVTQSSGPQLCRGDIAHVVDLPARMMTGSCVLGDFIPYKTPEK